MPGRQVRKRREGQPKVDQAVEAEKQLTPEQVLARNARQAQFIKVLAYTVGGALAGFFIMLFIVTRVRGIAFHDTSGAYLLGVPALAAAVGAVIGFFIGRKPD